MDKWEISGLKWNYDLKEEYQSSKSKAEVVPNLWWILIYGNPIVNLREMKIF